MKRPSTKNMVCTAGVKDRMVARLMIVAAAMLGLASAAMADAPVNDEQSSATMVNVIPYTNTIDTTFATTAPEDPDCFGHGTTVWYSFTPDETTLINANTIGSDYDTTLSVYSTDVEGLVQIDCHDDIVLAQVRESRIRFEAQANVTYLFMVGSYESSIQSALGGRLIFNLFKATPPLQIELAIDSRGTVSPTGSATLSGTVTCNVPADVYIDGSLRQRAGRFYLNGYGGIWTTIPCHGTSSWSLEVSSDKGWFVGGRVDANVNASSYDYYDDYLIDNETASATVRLTGSRR